MVLPFSHLWEKKSSLRLIPSLILLLEPRHSSPQHCPDTDVGATDGYGHGVPGRTVCTGGIPGCISLGCTMVGIPSLYHAGYPIPVPCWVSPHLCIMLGIPHPCIMLGIRHPTMLGIRLPTMLGTSGCPCWVYLGVSFLHVLVRNMGLS